MARVEEAFLFFNYYIINFVLVKILDFHFSLSNCYITHNEQFPTIEFNTRKGVYQELARSGNTLSGILSDKFEVIHIPTLWYPIDQWLSVKKLSLLKGTINLI